MDFSISFDIKGNRNRPIIFSLSLKSIFKQSFLFLLYYIAIEIYQVLSTDS